MSSTVASTTMDPLAPSTQDPLSTTSLSRNSSSRLTRAASTSKELQSRSQSQSQSQSQSHSQSQSQSFPTGTYPKPKSSYYFGPPDSSTAFGTPVTGKIGVHLPKEIVRIERDYSSGELPQFHSSFPLELEGRISPTTFSELVNDINALLIDAHTPSKTWRDNCLAILSFYLFPLAFGSHYQRTMTKLKTLVERLNKDILNQVGLNLAQPAKTAFLFIEIEYY
ncbi:hypothetical protein BCV70DRAFT_197847 [Testicularia cyperi]|uniref:Ras modification protein ERF4 n=1 Tax=Testicularia cyperi TaxID=1882483 RepID=A0A317Y0H7_9BASI|nr:hypothetical protein BCV70DRAFT_197847 [Testicularia cyperi]